MEFHRRRFPSCSNLTPCKMLKTDQTLSLDIGIVVTVAVDLTAMLARSGSPRMSVRRKAFRKLHFQRLFPFVKVTSRKYVQLFPFDHPHLGSQFPTYVTAQADADVACTFLSQCGPELCKVSCAHEVRSTVVWLSCEIQSQLHESRLSPQLTPGPCPWPPRSSKTLPSENLFRLISFGCPSTLRELVVTYRTSCLLTLQTKRGVNRPTITVQMVATPHHTGLTLKEATLVGVSVCPAGAMVPFSMWESEAMVKGTQSTHTKGMHPLGHSFAPTRRCIVCIRMNTGTSQTFKTWSQTHIQIRSNHNSGGVMTTAKIDDNILHLFQHRPQVILGDITVTRKMDRTPDSAEQNNKSVLFR